MRAWVLIVAEQPAPSGPRGGNGCVGAQPFIRGSYSDQIELNEKAARDFSRAAFRGSRLLRRLRASAVSFVFHLAMHVVRHVAMHGVGRRRDRRRPILGQYVVDMMFVARAALAAGRRISSVDIETPIHGRPQPCYPGARRLGEEASVKHEGAPSVLVSVRREPTGSGRAVRGPRPLGPAQPAASPCRQRSEGTGTRVASGASATTSWAVGMMILIFCKAASIAKASPAKAKPAARARGPILGEFVSYALFWGQSFALRPFARPSKFISGYSARARVTTKPARLAFSRRRVFSRVRLIERLARQPRRRDRRTWLRFTRYKK